MKSVIFAFLTTLFFSFSCDAQSVSAPANDNQFWNDLQLIFTLNKKVTATFSGSLRIGKNVTRPVDERVGLAFSYRVNKNLSFGAGYTYRVAQPLNGSRFFENRPVINATFTLPLKKKYKLLNRHQIDFRLINSRPNTWNYRNRTTFEREINVFRRKIKPYISAEFFYDDRRKDWFRGRYTIGINREFTKKLSADFFYMRQQDGISRPGNLNVIGTSWRIRLN